MLIWEKTTKIDGVNIHICLYVFACLLVYMLPWCKGYVASINMHLHTYIHTYVHTPTSIDKYVQRMRIRFETVTFVSVKDYGFPSLYTLRHMSKYLCIPLCMQLLKHRPIISLV